jgi:hypothetical protein
MKTYEADLDNRKRLPLAKIVGPSQTRFRVTPLESGEYLLTPLVSLSERELAFLSNPERVAAVREGIEQAREGKVVRYKPKYSGPMDES